MLLYRTAGAPAMRVQLSCGEALQLLLAAITAVIIHTRIIQKTRVKVQYTTFSLTRCQQTIIFYAVE